MKKQIIVSTTVAAAILGSAGLYVASINNANAERASVNDNGALLAVNSTLSSTSQISNSKDETVYVITDADGAAKTKFIGSTIYNGKEELPFDFKITYYLDGKEISAKDLAGKSGHVKIVYDYNSTAKYLGKYVPFAAVTGMSLDTSKFSNVVLENGKVISQTADNYLVAGYALSGLNENLDTNILPSSFVIEADVQEFSLGTVYTIFMNDIFADIDTSRLNDVDSLSNSMVELSDGLDKIIAGAGDLSNGLSTALDGTKTLYAGSLQLAEGASALSAGASELSNGLSTLASYSDPLVAGADQMIAETLATVNEVISENEELRELMATIGVDKITADNCERVLNALMEMAQKAGYEIPDAIISGVSKAKELVGFASGVLDYLRGVSSAAKGSQQIVAGASQLSVGAGELSAGLGVLVDGTTELYNGSVALKEGLNTFKITGIDKLVALATEDLPRVTSNLRGSVAAASSYHSYGGSSYAAVKFILKTPSI